MNYRQRHAEACRQAFEGFEPDFSRCRTGLEEANTILHMARNGSYTSEIAEAIGKTPIAVQKFFRRYNFPRLHNIAPPQGAERHDWKGGTKWMKGYEYQHAPDHPHATKSGHVATHRLVMEQKLGRYLLPTEVVDHIDADTTNNAPDNLRVFASNGEHLAATRKGRCPKWSEEGKKALDHARRQRRRTWKGVPRQPSPAE